MSKKELVKQIIDRLIREGEDFSDLSQSYLSELHELDGVSNTTIKRAKNEYKQQNERVKNNYKEQRIKKQIYKYLNRYPKATLGDLREEFPNIIPPKVSEYHLFWKRKQEKKLKKDQKGTDSITPRKLKEMVFNYLDEHPSVTTEQLNSVFENSNRSSLTSYFNSWKKKQMVDKESVKKGSLVQVLFDYLDKKPTSSIRDLQKAFTDVHRKSLEIYHSLWQKKRKDSEVTIVETIKQEVLQLVEKNNGSEGDIEPEYVESSADTSEDDTARYTNVQKSLRKSDGDNNQFQMDTAGSKSKRKPLNNTPAKSTPKTSKKTVNDGIRAASTEKDDLKRDLILSLENTIEAQKTIIDSLNFEQQVLKQKKKSLLFSSIEMDEQELARVKDFLTYYLEGYKLQKPDLV